MKLTRSTPIAALLARQPCDPAVQWIEEQGIATLGEAWDKCPDPYWMEWAVSELLPESAQAAFDATTKSAQAAFDAAMESAQAAFYAAEKSAQAAFAGTIRAAFDPFA